MGHLFSICAPFVLQLRSAVCPEGIGTIFLDVEQLKVFGIICSRVSVLLDRVMHSPMLDNDHAVLKRKHKALCDQYSQVIQACANMLCDSLWISDKSVIVCSQA